MQNGKKVTHRYFSDDEWMTIEDGVIVLEDGVRCRQADFWSLRTSEAWNDGYELFMGPINAVAKETPKN